MDKTKTKGIDHKGYYVSKITNCNVISIEGKLDQIEIELNNVLLGWVCLPKSAFGIWHSTYNIPYRQLYAEYLIDPTLKHLIGNIIFCKIGVKHDYEEVDQDNRLFFNSFFSLDIGKLLNEVTNTFKGQNTSFYSTPVPIFSMLKNGCSRIPFISSKNLELNEIEVLRSKHDKTLFLIQLPNKSTLFFQKIKDTNRLTSENAPLVFELFYKNKESRDWDIDIQHYVSESGITRKTTYFHRKKSGIRRTSSNIEIKMGDTLPKTYSDILSFMNNYYEYFEEVIENEQDFDDDNWVEKILTWAKDSTLQITAWDSLYGLATSKSLLRRQKQLTLFNVESLPPEIENLQSLKELTVGNVSPEKFFSEVLEIPSLESLKIMDSELSDIPKGISKLTELRKVCVDSELIVEIPIELADLSQLSELYIRYAPNIKTFPVEIINISTLKRLGVHIDAVSRLPKDITNKTDLIIEVHIDPLFDEWTEIPAIEFFDSSIYHDLIDGNEPKTNKGL